MYKLLGCLVWFGVASPTKSGNCMIQAHTFKHTTHETKREGSVFSIPTFEMMKRDIFLVMLPENNNLPSPLAAMAGRWNRSRFFFCWKLDTGGCVIYSLCYAVLMATFWRQKKRERLMLFTRANAPTSERVKRVRRIHTHKRDEDVAMAIVCVINMPEAHRRRLF